MKKLGVMASAALAGLMSIGAASAQDAPLKIIYASSADAGNAFWLSVKKGFDDACVLVGADCQMLFTGKVGDVQAQVANIQSAIAQSPDMIIIPIVDNNAFDEVIKEAMPGEMYRVFMHYKRDEWEKFLATVTEWDVNTYLDALP